VSIWGSSGGRGRARPPALSCAQPRVALWAAATGAGAWLPLLPAPLRFPVKMCQVATCCPGSFPFPEKITLLSPSFCISLSGKKHFLALFLKLRQEQTQILPGAQAEAIPAQDAGSWAVFNGSDTSQPGIFLLGLDLGSWLFLRGNISSYPCSAFILKC